MASSHTPADDDSMDVQSQTFPVEPPAVQAPAAGTGTSPGLERIREDRPEAHQSPPPSLTRSAVTSLCASDLAAAGENTWKRAMARLKCDQRYGPPEFDGSNVLSDYVKYPRYIKEQECVEWVTEFENRKNEKQRLELFNIVGFGLWANALPESSFEDTDPYDVKRWLNTLLYAWDSHETAHARKNVREEEIRLGPDVLIELAFEFRSGGKHVRRAELDMVLPASPWTARADNVCMMSLPNDWMNFLMGLPNRHIFSSDLFMSLEVVTFVCEDKVQDEKTAFRQLIMDFCSSQNQRRALGFRDSHIFGAVVNGLKMKIYSSEWSDDRVIIRYIRFFDLNHFRGFLACYIFLCKLADLAASDVQQALDQWQSESGKQVLKEHSRQEASKTPWRFESPPAGRNKKRRRDGGGAGAAGGGAREDMESQYSTDTMEMLDEDVDEIPTQIQTVDDECVPLGGDTLSERNLLTFTEHTRAGHVLGAKTVGAWAREISEKSNQPAVRANDCVVVGNK